MLPKWHALIGLIFCTLLFWIFNIPFIALLIIWIFNIGIDIDHYIIYIINKKNWSLSKTYRYFITLKKPSKYYFCFFHTFEFLAFVAIISLFNKWIFFAFLGLVFHVIVDLITMAASKEKNRIMFFSAIARFIRYKNKKQRQQDKS